MMLTKIPTISHFQILKVGLSGLRRMGRMTHIASFLELLPTKFTLANL
jgi:hypothetical protein